MACLGIDKTNNNLKQATSGHLWPVSGQSVGVGGHRA